MKHYRSACLYIYLARLALILLLAVTITLATNDISVSHASSTDVSSVPYAYKLSISRYGISPIRALLLDKQRVLVVGSVGDTHGVVVLRIGDPYSEATIEDMYPLTGYPTSFAIDGYPVSRVAVGSDKGEILLLRIDRGRITRHLYTILGTDFHVVKITLVKTGIGDLKIIALTSETGQRSYPCLDCHVYVLDEDASGIMRIGPRTGNATYTCGSLEAVRIQDISALLIYSENGFYYDASRVVISYIPQLVSLEFSLSYVDETSQTIMPLPHALVEVQLTYVEQNLTIVYGVNADDNGFVRVPIPRLERSILRVALVIRDHIGRPVHNYTYVHDPLQYRDIPDTIPLPSVVLPTRNVDTTPAVIKYGAPPFLYTRLDIYDLSRAPSTCIRVATSDFNLEPHYIDLIYLRGAHDVYGKLLYYDQVRGYLHITTIDVRGGKISQLSTVRDYVGMNLKIVGAGTYVDGRYLVIGLADGRLRLYSKEGLTYRLRSIYAMGLTLIDLLAIPDAEVYTYVAISNNGIQVIRAEPRPFPVFRGLTSLYLTTMNYVTGSVLGDLSTIVVLNYDEIVIVRNADALARDQRNVTLDQLIVADVNLFFNIPGIGELSGSLVELVHPGGSINYTLSFDLITLRNIIPGVRYTVNIYPNAPYFKSGSVSFRLREDRSIEIVETRNINVTTGLADHPSLEITLQRFTCVLNVELSDPYGIVGRFNLFANGVSIRSDVSESARIEMPCGHYVVYAEPTMENQAFYDRSVAVTVDLAKNMTVRIPLNRRVYALRLKVLEGNNPIQNARVKITNLYTGALVMSINTDIEGSISLYLPSGFYRVEITHDQYNTETVDMFLAKDVTTNVELKPTIITLILRSTPLILGVAIIAVVVYVSMRIKSRVEARIAKEEYI